MKNVGINVVDIITKLKALKASWISRLVKCEKQRPSMYVFE